MFAEVAFPISNFQSFTYVIPKELKNEIQLGSRVLAPFGKRNCQGMVLGIKSTTSYSGKTKSIHSLVDDIPVVTPELWKLICWPLCKGPKINPQATRGAPKLIC